MSSYILLSTILNAFNIMIFIKIKKRLLRHSIVQGDLSVAID